MTQDFILKEKKAVFLDEANLYLTFNRGKKVSQFRSTQTLWVFLKRGKQKKQ